MGLPWVRLDSNIATHDKILALVTEREGHRALAVYCCSLGYAGGHLTDGYIPRAALTLLHGTEKHAILLVEHRLWEYAPGGVAGYVIHNWDERQELAAVAASKEAGRKAASKKANCVRHHGKACGCWRDDDG